VRVLLAADAQWLVDELVAALAGPDVSFTVCSECREVSKVVADRTEKGEPFDVAIVDLQIGSMGGMAVTLALRLDESAGIVPHVPVVMLLDRVADVHLARRSATEGWLVKPLDPLRVDRAVSTVLAGGTYREGLNGIEVVRAPEPGEPEADVLAIGASE
jgi:DNA-binding NarL/FixJ family response regulator